MNRIIISLLLSIFLSSCALFRPATKVAVDQKSEEFLEQGKKLLRGESYPEAMDAFEQAIGTEYHRSQTSAVFLSGLSAYYAEFYDVAKKRFSRLKSEFPKSKYIEEANYHIALIQLKDSRSYENQRGLLGMMELSKKAKSGKIRSDALNQFRHSLFRDVTLNKLQLIESKIAPEYKAYWLEAVMYKLLADDKQDEAKAVYEKYATAGGKSTDYIKKMLGDQEGEKKSKVFEPEIKRIALALPMHFGEANNFGLNVPAKVTIALEFYQGFEMAVRKYNETNPQKIFLELLDTERDTASARALNARLDKLAPGVLIGAIYNNQSKILSEWAESRSIPMIVPISPAEDLVQDKQYTFLGHPSLRIQGVKMADYAFNELGLTHVYVFRDGGAATMALSNGFTQTFTDLGGKVDSMTFSSNYDAAIKQIPKLVGEVEDDSAGVYIPVMSNEEAAGLVVNVLKQKNKNLPIMGSPHFKSRYNAIPRDIKESYQLYFTTSHLSSKDEMDYRGMEQEYLKEFAYPPSDWTVQGYDLANYVLDQLGKFDPEQGYTFDTFLRVGGRFKTLHIDYHFNSTQVNQAVNIGQYVENGLEYLDY